MLTRARLASYHRDGMTLRADIDHLRRILAASLPTGARAAELFIESRLGVHLTLEAGGAGAHVERRWETGAHLRRFSEGRHESFVLDAPTHDSLEALALHPEAVSTDWLSGAPPVGVTRERADMVTLEASLSDADPAAAGGPWSPRFLAEATALASEWLAPVGDEAGTVTLEACLQEILVITTDRDSARDTRSFVDATLRLRSSQDVRAVPMEETRSAATLAALAGASAGPHNPAAALLGRAGRARESAPAPNAAMPVVFASPSGGFLLHEVCGHLLEADHVLLGVSPFTAARGRAIASPLLTLADDGSIPGMRGSTLFDDEGVAARRTPLIMDGILVGYLSDRLTSISTSGISTGNGRRQSYRDAPMPRMTNLVIDPGKATFDEILGDTKAGLLVTRLGRGRVDPATGLFALSVEEGFLIEHGRAARSVAGVVLRGRAADLLQAIDAVGNDAVADTGAPMCVKQDQAIPFGILQPTLRVSSMTVTGRS